MEIVIVVIGVLVMGTLLALRGLLELDWRLRNWLNPPPAKMAAEISEAEKAAQLEAYANQPDYLVEWIERRRREFDEFPPPRY